MRLAADAFALVHSSSVLSHVELAAFSHQQRAQALDLPTEGPMSLSLTTLWLADPSTAKLEAQKASAALGAHPEVLWHKVVAIINPKRWRHNLQVALDETGTNRPGGWPVFQGLKKSSCFGML